MSDSAQFERREVHYEGRVQGVGFRYNARSIGQRFTVGGYVRNLPDGRVHLVAEGRVDQLDTFLAELAEAMGHFITDCQVSYSSANGKFSVFEIRP